MGAVAPNGHITSYNNQIEIMNTRSIKEIVYEYINEAIQLWRQENIEEIFIDKHEVIDLTLELLSMDNMTNPLIHKDMKEEVSSQLWENEEDYFDV